MENRESDELITVAALQLIYSHEVAAVSSRWREPVVTIEPNPSHEVAAVSSRWREPVVTIEANPSHEVAAVSIIVDQHYLSVMCNFLNLMALGHRPGKWKPPWSSPERA